MVYIASHAPGLAVLLCCSRQLARLTPALDSANRTTGVVRIGVGIGVWICLLCAVAVLQLLRPAILLGLMGITHVLVDRAAYVPFPLARWNYLADPTRAAALYTSPDGALTLYQRKVPRRG